MQLFVGEIAGFVEEIAAIRTFHEVARTVGLVERENRCGQHFVAIFKGFSKNFVEITSLSTVRAGFL